MNYAYDIYLNFSEVPIDSFDWNRNDKLIHIKKIPIFMIDVHNYKKLLKYNVKLDKKFVKCVHNLTEVWNNITKIKNCALFSDSFSIIAIMFDDDGNTIKKSFLNIDEELEIIDTISELKIRNINFKKINNTKINFKTRKEISDKNFIFNEIKNITNDKLNYIYYECFNKYGKNLKAMKKDLINISIDNQSYQKLYNILKLTSTKKN